MVAMPSQVIHVHFAVVHVCFAAVHSGKFLLLMRKKHIIPALQQDNVAFCGKLIMYYFFTKLLKEGLR